MDTKKKFNSKEKAKDVNEKSLERLHRSLFDHPSEEEWSATRSLAQPSFLKQVNSRAVGHSEPLKVSPTVPKDNA